ncbi:NAD-dependent epimerase/dehydratase family protein [Paenibacillus assamensis]|uniref:NAD-dependent epimerase/dehydratase family protein n=1 Tax=Paenibacillus assamensis TaxID=311244 RepID=UPI0003F9FF5F|nr:NAD-dependent epimerase/dehydratase family protein [Paenibacillus assamensis]
MKILVTGGAGFIGSNIVDSYIEAGHDVIVVDDLSSGCIENINSKARFYQVDIQSTEIVKIIEEERPNIINHHAAQKSVPKSVDDPILDANINVIGLLNLLNAAVSAQVSKIIFASSGGALSGNTDVIPTSENCEPSLISPYAITKYISEKYLHFYQITYGLNYTVLRYSNVYGPRQNADGECGVVPIFMNNILNNNQSYLFTYEDMPLGTTRDYVYVADVCKANISALENGDNNIFNIGTGKEISISEIYNIILDMSSRSELPLIRKAERKGDVRRSALCSKKANKDLKWEASTSLHQGIRETFSFLLSKHR